MRYLLGRSKSNDGLADLSLEDHQETLALINEELSASLERQKETGGRLDTKAVFLAGFAATAAQFLATRQHLPIVLAALSFAAYGGSFASAILSLAVTRYQDLQPRALLDRYGMKPTAEVLGRLCAHKADSYQKNARRHQRKASVWWLSLASLSAGLVLSVATLLEAGHHG